LVVIVLERVTPALRGELTRWMLELRAGVFVGTLSGMVRDRLWDYACSKIGRGGGVMVYTTNTEQGFATRYWGEPTRALVDFDGLTLIQIPADASAADQLS
jgi:CRISPR-associated protein Cas2